MSEGSTLEAAARRGLLPRGLPEVRESDDAGEYYCAHALYLGHVAMEREVGALARDSHGDPLVGFLHVPADARATDPSAHAGGERHRATVVVVAAALRGWIAELARRSRGPLALLVTGFGPFRDVVDNPTGDFVRDLEHVAAALRLAFESVDVVVEQGRVRARVDVDGAAREVVVSAAELPVDDRSLQWDGDRSLLALLEGTGAQAWLGLGVCKSEHYRVETHPHDGGLVVDESGGRHQADSERSRALPPNRSLARAILEGGRGLG